MNDLFNQYKLVKDKECVCAATILDSLIETTKNAPDKVREALGSVAFRKLEEYISLRAQSEAAFDAWFNKHMQEPLPFA